MPIREFHCNDCAQEFEKILRASDDINAVACPSCGGTHLERKLSTFAARATTGASAPAQAPMSCPGGMCSMPGMCGAGRN